MADPTGGGGGFGSGLKFGEASAMKGAIGSFGAAVGDLYAQEGLEISAKGYRTAAGFSRENLGYVEENNRLKKLMAERQIYKALGGQENDIAASGLAASGSALDIMRDSAAQADLTRQMLETQGKIDINQVRQQINAYDTQAEAADKAADAKGVSSMFNFAAGIVSVGSFFL